MANDSFSTVAHFTCESLNLCDRKYIGRSTVCPFSSVTFCAKHAPMHLSEASVVRIYGFEVSGNASNGA